MTKAQATRLKTKWKKQGGTHCEHTIQELASSDLKHSHVLNTYHCRDCGELIVHRLKGNAQPDSRLMEIEPFNEP